LLLGCCSDVQNICTFLAEAIAAMKRIQAFLLLPETEEQLQASEPQAVIVSGNSNSGITILGNGSGEAMLCRCNHFAAFMQPML
jgi:hypothetical protein